MNMRAPWWVRDADACWHPYTQHGLAREPLAIRSARGAWLELADGCRLLDGISSWWACLHGHGHPRLVEALTAQARQLDHVLFAGCTHEPAVTLAEQLLAKAPAGLSRVFYSDNGSTAVEVALKACYAAARRRGEAQRSRFIALRGGYHGDTFGAMAVGEPDPFFREFAPLLFRVERSEATIEALERCFATHGAETAALILEPIVQGAAGMRPVPAAVVHAARRLCDKHGVYLVADEVMTGFGRTGTLFACEQADVTPDALCLAKGLTGGMLPLAATLFTESIFDAFRSEDRAAMFFHGHTFTAHPLGCAVALASLELARTENTPGLLARLGTRIEAGLRERLGAEPTLRRFGGIVALDVGAGGGYAEAGTAALGAACASESPDVLLRPLGDTLYAMPPACTTREEADLIAERMAAVVVASRASS